MAQNIQFKRGTKAKNDNFIGPDGSLSVDKESKTLRIHNGTTAGGAFTILDQQGVNNEIGGSISKTFPINNGIGTQEIVISEAETKNAVFYISGPLAGNSTLVFPTAGNKVSIRPYIIWNNTSGDFTLKAKTASQPETNAITIPKGDRVFAFTDGGGYVRDAITQINNLGNYRKTAKSIKNWDYATDNGIYMGDNNCLNSPVADRWSMGHVENHGGNGYCTQFVHCFANDVPANTLTYRREQNDGTFGAWYRLRLSEEEQKAIFMPLTGGVVETKTIGDNSQYIANTEYVSDYIGSWRVISPPDAGGDLVVSLTMAAASALSISGNPSNDVNLIFDDSIPSNINYRSRIIRNDTNKNLVVKNLTGPTVTIAKSARVTVYSNGSGFFRTEEDNELIYGNQSIGYVVVGNLEFSGTGIGKQSVRQWVSAISDAGYKTISLPVGCIPHSITGVTTGPENATAYSLKITYAKDGSFQYSFRVAVVNSSNAYVSGIPFNISVEGSM